MSEDDNTATDEDDSNYSEVLNEITQNTPAFLRLIEHAEYNWFEIASHVEEKFICTVTPVFLDRLYQHVVSLHHV